LHNKVRSVACGSVHTVAIATDGEVYVWGRKSEGRLGLGPIPSGETKSFTSEPIRNHFLSPATINDTITKVACGGEHTIALSSKGLIFSWGSGRYGQNGSGSFAQVNKPRVVSSLFGVNLKDIACGEFVSTAISEAGDLYSWGMGRNLQLGKGGSDNMTNEAHPSISQQLSNRLGFYLLIFPLSSLFLSHISLLLPGVFDKSVVVLLTALR
jgi:alpha-tubulin suppressor-like RCC1 family protein